MCSMALARHVSTVTTRMAAHAGSQCRGKHAFAVDDCVFAHLYSIFVSIDGDYSKFSIVWITSIIPYQLCPVSKGRRVKIFMLELFSDCHAYLVVARPSKQ